MTESSRPRALLVLGIVAGVLGAVAVVLVIVAVLQRMPVAGEAVPAPSVSAPVSVRPSASASASSEAAEPDALTLSPKGFAVTDAAGAEVFAFAWRDPAAPAVAALSAAFGAEPTQRVQPGDGSHFPDYTVYEWDGFALFDMIETPGGQSRDEAWQPSYVIITADEVRGVAIEPEVDVRIGMTADEVRALGPSDEYERDDTRTRFVFESSDAAAAAAPIYSTFVDVSNGAVSAILMFPLSQL